MRLLKFLRILTTKLVLGGVFLSAISGCVSSADTKAPRFYLLSTLPQEQAALVNAPANPPLAVDLASLTIPQYLQRPEVVTRVDQNRLVLSEFDNWGGSLEKNMLRVMATNLAILLNTPEVHVANRRLPAGIAATVEIDVMQFERGPNGRAALAAQWRLLKPGRDRTPIVSRISRLQSDPLADASSIDDTVAAMSDVLAELSTTIAQAIIDTAQR